MNNEIKEILDEMINLNDYVNYKIYGKRANEIGKLLLDYITNLQQQLHQASLDIQELTERDIGCPSWCDKLNNLQQELQEEKRIEEADLKTIQRLEEENERLQENNQAMQEEMARVWEENERLKETNVYCNRTDCVGRIKDSRKYDSVYQEKEDYKSRCEKAIEYIMVDYNDCKKLIDKDDITDLTDSYWQGVAITSRDLLNILQNGDNSND